LGGAVTCARAVRAAPKATSRPVMKR